MMLGTRVPCITHTAFSPGGLALWAGAQMKGLPVIRVEV